MKTTSVKPGDLQLKFAAIWHEQIAHVIHVEDLQLLTLRYHALLEVALRDLLAVRLNIPVPKLPDLTFEKAARLALGGLRHELLDLALTINRIRNYVAHQVDVRELDAKIRDLVSANKILDTEWPPAGLPRHERWANILNAVLVAVSTMTTATEDFKREHSDPNKTKFLTEGYSVLLFSVFAAATLNIRRLERGEPPPWDD